DLHARTAQRRDEESRDNRREQAALGADPAGDREGDRQGQCHNADDDTRHQVGKKLLAGVPRERGHELRDEPVQNPCAGQRRRNLRGWWRYRASPRSWSSENAPPPVTSNAARAPSMTRWYSNPSPLACPNQFMKKPFGRCTSTTAPTMTPASNSATTRVPRPSTNRSGPTASARIPIHPATVGTPRLLKYCSVPEGPWPPNHPNSFWAPCGNITPATVRRSRSPVTLPVVWKMRLAMRPRII